MDNITVYVDGQALDLWDAEKVNLSAQYSISDIQDIDATKNSITKEIKVPATKRNRLIFGYPEDINSADMITQKTAHRGLVECLGVEVMKGRVKMLKSVTKESTEFSFNIIGDNGDWRNFIESKRLKDLDLTDQDHELTRDNVVASEDQNSGLMYSYPLINIGRVGDYKGTGSRLPITSGSSTYVVRIRLTKEKYTPPFQTGTSYIRYAWENFIGKQVSLEGFGLGTGGIATVTAQQAGSYMVNGVQMYGECTITLGTDIEITNGATGTVSFLEGNHFVKAEDRVPAIQIKGLVDRLFKDSGYRIKSRFLDNIGRRLYMLKGTDNGNALDEDQEAQFSFNVGLTSNKTYNPGGPPAVIGNWEFPGYYILELDNIESDAAGLYNTVDHYWSPSEAGRYKFTFQGLITSYPVGSFKVMIIKEYLSGYYDILGSRELFNTTEPAIDFDFEVSTTITSFSSFIQPGEKVYVLIGNVGNDPLMNNNQITVKTVGTKFVNEIFNPAIGYNSIISLNRFLPDNNGLELLQGLKQLFNLYFLTDVGRGIIYMEPEGDFYKDSVVNWSGKMDLDRDQEITELGQDMPSKNLYTYMQDAQDNKAQLIEDSTDIRIASRTMELLNIFNTEEPEENVNDIFSPTLMEKCIEGNGAIKFDTTEIPYIRNNQERYDFETRLLFFEGKRLLPAGETWNFDGLPRNWYPKFFSIDRNNYNYNSLYFNDVEKAIGLGTRYYGGLYERLNNSRMLTAYFNLKPTDVEPLVNIDTKIIKDYRARIFIGDGKEGGYYRLDSIQDYSPNTKQPTKVSLVKDTDRNVIPVYPIMHVIVVSMTATDTVAGGLTTITVVFRNLGSAARDIVFRFIMPETEDAIYDEFTIPGHGDFTYTTNIVTNADLQSGSYTVYMEPSPDVYEIYGDQLFAEADFYIEGCTSPAAFIKVGPVVYNPPLDQLSAGMSVAVSFTVKNTGCLTGSTAQICTVDNRDLFGDGQYYSAFIQIINLPGGQSVTKTFIINNLQAADLRLDFTGSVFTEHVVETIEASNPNSPPIIISSVPAHNATGIAIGTSLKPTWNMPITIQPGGYCRVYRYVNGNSGNVQIVQEVPSSAFVVVNSTTFEIFINTLESNVTYCVTFSAGVVKSAANIGNLAVTFDAWKFTTRNTLVMEIGDDFQGVNKGGTTRNGGNGWATARAALTGSTQTTLYRCGVEVWNGNADYGISRGHIYFDTNGVLPVGATLDAAEMIVNVSVNENGACIVQSTTTTLTMNSYSEKLNVLLYTVPGNVFGVQVCPIPVSAINLTAKTGFVLLHPFDFLNNQPTLASPGQPEWFFRGLNFRLKLYYHV